ncbi:ABC transporter permease [Kordiimonas marina]|uniref:ABC transporter permease n=1 Tax=Kordiimonas marina TaxID=2872312 RepID=UPI001FF43DDA|nr:FtsX-like permease family protein [Kordiimonas marina]MCJ9428347.1 FtsX-like permease family protein [Kordiimonas marina]
MISRNEGLPVAIRLAIRELRGGLSGFRVFVACLILGVAAIAAVGSLTRAIEDGMDREGRSILGADIEVNIFQNQIAPDALAYLESQGTVSKSARLRTMARKQGGDRSTLVELRAVDSAYPLYGKFVTTPELDNAALFEERAGSWGAAVDPMLADRLGVKLGDKLTFGNITADIRAFIGREPDKANMGFELGPTVMIRRAALEKTGLVTLGSLVNYYYKVKLPETLPPKTVVKALKTRFPDATWRLRDRSNGAPGMRRFIEQMGMFLTLVGISALVVGGVGVGNAVKGYMDRKTRTIATLKILGAPGSTVFATYFTQVLLIGFAAIVAGLILGAFLPGILARFLPDSLPIRPDGGVYPVALGLAALYGILITVAFTVWPLAKARDLPAVRLFRALVAPEKRRPRKRYILLVIMAALAIAALAVGVATNHLLAAGFMGGAALTLLLLRFVSWLLERTAAHAPRPKGVLRRLAVANLHRPGAATGAVVLSLGLGLTLFATLALIEGNMDKRIKDQVPSVAPAFFMLDIQRYQLADFEKTAKGLAGVSDVTVVPSLRGRIKLLNGVPADPKKVAENVRWVLRGDRGLSYMDTLSKGSHVVAGNWWPAGYDGPPEISLGKEAADGLGLKVGDTMTITVLGRDVKARIASLREINWGTFGFNFVILFDPHTLRAAPHTYMATLKAAGDAEANAHRVLTNAFPNITAVRMKDVLSKFNDMLGQVGTAVRATALVSIIAGILVLAGAIAAGFRQRVYDSVILKVVGAVRKQVLGAYLMEFALIGLITALIALGLGSLAGWIVVKHVMEMEFHFLPVPMLLTVSVSLVVTVVIGMASSWRALSVKPNAVLRNE